ncbi:NTTRR-F1 domain [Marinicrinis lubricantis]|uniref:NTTRR-F1 domain n=1 Tax=Marinicrinis lubricantis TaxID=2086470 RepID=A0ABW1IKP0_9BACL
MSDISRKEPPSNLLQPDWTTYFHAKPYIETSFDHQKIICFSNQHESAYILQKVQLQIGKTYLFSARFAKEGKAEGAPFVITIQYYDMNKKLLEFGLYAHILKTDMEEADSGWYEYRGITKKVPEATLYALVIINKISSIDVAPVLVANCQLIDITI